MNSDKKFVGLMSEEEEAEKLQKTLISEAKHEGRVEGIAEGIAEGSKQKEIEIAKNMLNKNIDVDTISEVTGLTKEKIESLR